MGCLLPQKEDKKEPNMEENPNKTSKIVDRKPKPPQIVKTDENQY